MPTRREFLEWSALTAALALPAATSLAAEADSQPVGPLTPVPFVRQRPEWRSFIILVWQWQTDVRRDAALYDLAGLRGFHIDYGAGEDDVVRFSLSRMFPYYVDHAAGKGILYLAKDVQAAITGKASL